MRILVVEDDEKWAYLLGALLQPIAFRVEVVTTLGDAKERMSRRTYSVILLDLWLPDSTPENTMKEIPRMRATGSKVVIITACPADDLTDRGKCADGYVYKGDVDIAAKLKICALA